jgi:hypothetical protein
MDLSFDSGGTAQRNKCSNCQSRYLRLQRFILEGGDAYAYVVAEAHRHTGGPEIYFFCTIGTWDDDSPKDDHTTFSCRYGLVDGQEDYAFSLIDVDDDYTGSFVGKRLSRKAALKHPKIHEFWEVMDFLILSDLDIHDFLHHPAKSYIKTRFRLSRD